MRMFLVDRETQARRNMAPPYENADHVIVYGACQHCGASPFKVAGVVGTMHATPDDQAYEACGACVACRETVGTLRVEPGTVFGVTEDAAVMGSGVRVY